MIQWAACALLCGVALDKDQDMLYNVSVVLNRFLHRASSLRMAFGFVCQENRLMPICFSAINKIKKTSPKLVGLQSRVKLCIVGCYIKISISIASWWMTFS